MRGKLVLTFLAGLAVGLAVSVVAGQRAMAEKAATQAALAAAQQQGKAAQVAGPQWEYKAVLLPSGVQRGDDASATIQLNRLAEDRWEYAWVLSPGSSTHTTNALVVFRRPKK